MSLNWFAQAPKVELHVHLEGAIPLPALWELVCKYGGDSEVARASQPVIQDNHDPEGHATSNHGQDAHATSGLAAIQRRFVYRDFPHFIQTWKWKNQFLREYEDFAFIARAVAQEMASQNIRYAEMFYSPSSFERRGLDVLELTAAVRRGLGHATGIKVNLIADLVRDFGPQSEQRTLEELRDAKELGVIGIGIGGSEDQYPPAAFAGLFERARELGFHTTAHAGEAAGPQSIWSALRDLRVERIGHATTAIQDTALVEHLRKEQIGLELCPVSNVRTGAIRSIKEHPVRRYFDMGLLCTINSDDPAMFQTSLPEEYRLLHEQLGFSFDELRQLVLNGIKASWLSAEDKQLLAEEFQRGPAWLGDQ